MAWRRLMLMGLCWGALLAGLAAAAAPTPAPMEITVCDELLDTTRSLTRFKAFKEMGATSVQSYIYWKDLSNAPGQYNWAAFDRYVGDLRASGLKWVPFVVAGPWYLTPEYARPKDKVTFARCLEHREESLIPSIWCPEFRKSIEAYLQAFADHYLATGILESVNLGITGDYGEAIYQVTGNWPGSYHTHPGMWCGDPLAVADLQRRCRKEYGNEIDRLNAAWNTHYADFGQIRPFNRLHAPSPAAWVFVARWYRDSMTDYADWWLATARRIFKDTPLYLCTGGDMTPEHGSDFAAQSKVAARHGAGVRITNEASSLPANVYLTRLVASATRFYGGYCGFEPAATVTPVGTLGRLFNAHSSGARQLFVYAGNVLDGDKPNAAWQLLRQHNALMRRGEPQNEVAVFYGTTNWLLERLEAELFFRLRDGLDYDFVDERMVQDGALDRYKVLVVNNIRWMPRPVAQAIADWVRRGGSLLTLNTRAMDLDEQTATWDELIGLTPASRETVGICIPNMRLLKPELLPSFKDAEHWTVATAVNHLTSDSMVLLRMGEPAGGANAWLRPVGKGLVLGYWGPGNISSSEAEWNVLPPLVCLFLKDGMDYLVRQNILSGPPGWLWRDGKPLYFTRMKGGTLVAFNPDATQAAQFSWLDQTFKVAPQSINVLTPAPQKTK